MTDGKFRFLLDDVQKEEIPLPEQTCGDTPDVGRVFNGLDVRM